MVRRPSRAFARHCAGADAAAPALGRRQPGDRRAADWARSAVRGGLPVPDPAPRSGRRPWRLAAALRGLRKRFCGRRARNVSRNPGVDRGRARGAFAQLGERVSGRSSGRSRCRRRIGLRAALGQPTPLQRPASQALPEIADRPSIAVLPFEDLSEPSAPRDPYLGEFVTEEITATLSRIRGLFVCSRHSAFRLSGSPEGRARHRRRARRALSRRRGGFAKRDRTALQCAPDRRAHRPSYLGGSRWSRAAGEQGDLRDRIVRETAAHLEPARAVRRGPARE